MGEGRCWDYLTPTGSIIIKINEESDSGFPEKIFIFIIVSLEHMPFEVFKFSFKLLSKLLITYTLYKQLSYNFKFYSTNNFQGIFNQNSKSVLDYEQLRQTTFFIKYPYSVLQSLYVTL